MNALIINDEEFTVEMLKDGIRWDALQINQVFTAYSAEEAKDVFSREEIDVFLCDIEMPGEDGIQLIRWVRENKIDSDCILLTCHADFEYAQEAVRLGCQDYQLLPARYEVIEESIFKVLEKRKQRKQDTLYEQFGKAWLTDQKQQVSDKDPRSAAPRPVEQCVQYIMEHLSDPELNVQAISDHLFLNRSYLNRLFTKEKNVSISQFIINERMKLAAALLRTTTVSIEVIAEQTGYRSTSYFTASFSRYHGMSPSQYRKGE